MIGRAKSGADPSRAPAENRPVGCASALAVAIAAALAISTAATADPAPGRFCRYRREGEAGRDRRAREGRERAIADSRPGASVSSRFTLLQVLRDSGSKSAKAPI